MTDNENKDSKPDPLELSIHFRAGAVASSSEDVRQREIEEKYGVVLAYTVYSLFNDGTFMYLRFTRYEDHVQDMLTISLADVKSMRLKFTKDKENKNEPGTPSGMDVTATDLADLLGDGKARIQDDEEDDNDGE